MSEVHKSDKAALRTEADKVDLFAEARATQMKDEITRNRAGMVKLIAPAKVNLFLGIGARRENGYHDATSVMHAINLHDIVYLKKQPGADDVDGLSVRVNTSSHEGIAPLALASEDNIAHRAIVKLANCLGRSEHETIDVHIQKHIPFQAGLGGGSSNAAAALVGVARLWGVAADDAVLEQVAHELGSDVAFFLYGGCACFGGTGEVFQHQLVPMKKNIVLIKPDEGVSTAAAYRTFDENPQPIDEQASRTAQCAESAREVPLFNNLAAASEELLPVLLEVRLWAQDQPGVEGVLLCGSGSTTFALCADFDAACRLSVAARQRGWWARATTFGSAKAAAVPRA